MGVSTVGKRKNQYIFAPEREKRRGPGCFPLLLALALAAVVFCVLINSAMNDRPQLDTVKATVMSLEKTFEGFTVLHFSDLHADKLGTETDTWRTLLYGKRFEAVVLTGDMVGKSGNAEPLLSLIATLKQVNAAAPIYFIAGDDDPPAVISIPRGKPEVMADWVLQAQEAGALYLDAPMYQEVGKRKVWFVPEFLYEVDVAGMLDTLTRQKESMEAEGKQYESEGGASYRSLCNRLDAMQRSADALKQMTAQDLQVAVSHFPLETEYVRMAADWADETAIFNFRNISLVLAGHYVGGQWQIPGFGPVYVPEKGWFPGAEGLMGMQRINSINQYVSVGVGASDFYPMPGRVFNPPGAALISFTAKLE